MKLGYLMIPPRCNRDTPARAKMAQTLGVSEFYMAEPHVASDATSSFATSPEQAPVLRTVSGIDQPSAPQIVAINGKRQFVNDASPLTHPAVTPGQVAACARDRRATLSVSWLTPSELAQHWAAHVTASTHAGLRTHPEDWRIARSIMVCDDPARAEATIMSKDSPCRAYYSRILPPGADVDAVLGACVLYGSLDTVLGALQELRAATGPFGTLTLVDHPWRDQAMARHSLTALTSALLPGTTQDKAPYAPALGRRLS